MKAVAAIAGAVQRQASMLAFERIFLVFRLLFLVSIPLILTLKFDRTLLRGGADAH